MSTASLTQTIARPVADVFAIITDITTFPDWNPTTVSAVKITDGPIGEGTRYRMAIRGFSEQELELQEFEDQRHVRLVPFSKMVGGGHRFALRSQGGGTRIDHELVMELKGVYRVMQPFLGPLSRKNLNETATALKRYLES